MTLAISESLAALLERQRAVRDEGARTRPPGYLRPAYGTEAYRAAYRAGWISFEEWEADELARSARADRARSSRGRAGPQPARWGREAPQDSRQYANQMATTAARDDRLTPQAKALLQVIRARCGRGQETETTKATLAAIMSRHARSIQRYLGELQRFGYIETRNRRGAFGLYTGLFIRITEKVAPFYAKAAELAGWLMRETAPLLDLIPGFADETGLSPKNDSPKSPSLRGAKRPAFGVT